jgi:hypothetical protein
MHSDFLADQVTRKSPFSTLYTSFGVWPGGHYMPLHNAPLAVLRFPTQAPLALCGSQDTHNALLHASEQDALPVACLISKQVVPYQTRGDTGCFRGVYS